MNQHLVPGLACAEDRCWFCGRPQFVSILNTGQGPTYIKAWSMCRRCALGVLPIGHNSAFPLCLPADRVVA